MSKPLPVLNAEAIKNLNNKRINITSAEFETSYKRNGKQVYGREFVIDIETATSYNVDTNITNVSEMWINNADSYIQQNTAVLPTCQYHTSTDWNRTYIMNNKIYFEFGSVYSSLSKTAHIVLLYTKN